MFGPPSLQQALARLSRVSEHNPHDPDLRMVVQARARDACEYCLMPTSTRFQVDHIVPESRWQDYVAGSLLIGPQPGEQGPNHLDNFAWSCPFCNTSKSDRVSWRVGRRDYPLFNPRLHRWEDHFLLTDRHLLIVGTTGIGTATERALSFNDPRSGGPLAIRHRAILWGAYPPPWARSWGF